MMPRLDLEGERFGRLVALVLIAIKGQPSRWSCVCDCGKFVVRRASYLREGSSLSCGCIRSERATARAKTGLARKHGRSASSAYSVWINMRERCRNPKCHAYKWYGARGIDVCKRWEKFEHFYQDMGDRPQGRSLDRIDNNKGYSPDNCRWATHIEQANNRRPRAKKRKAA